jgi:dienelactone hydrolase
MIAVPASQPTSLGAQTETSQKDLFHYEYSKEFNIKEGEATKKGDVVIQDIDYPSFQNRDGRIKAYLVRSARSGRSAGVVFFHWLGETKADRTEFLDDAVELAQRGTVSLLIQGFFPWVEKPVDGEKDMHQVIDQTIEVRRAIDLLLLQPDVDPRRIGFVGHDYGAMFGSIVSGLEHRLKSYVLMAGIGTFSEWSLKYWPKTATKGEEVYRKAISVVDPIGYIGGAAPASSLFQFSNNDKYITRTEAEQFFKAASDPKTIKWYDADHQLETDKVRQDRLDWLSQQLSLSPEKSSQSASR